MLLLLFFLMSLGVCKRQQMIHVLFPNERSRLDIKSNRCSEQTAMQCSSLSLSALFLSLWRHTHLPLTEREREREREREARQDDDDEEGEEEATRQVQCK
jgi:hypothetical protein